MSFASNDEPEFEPPWYVTDAEWWELAAAFKAEAKSGRRLKRNRSRRVVPNDQTTPQAAVAANTISDERPKRNRSGCVLPDDDDLRAINVHRESQAKDEKCEAARNHHRSGGCRAPQVLEVLCRGAVRKYLCGKCGKDWWSRAAVKDAVCLVCQQGHWCSNCKMALFCEQRQRAIHAKKAEVAAAIHHHQTGELQATDEELEAARHHHRSCGCCALQVFEVEEACDGAVRRRYLCGRCGKLWWSGRCPRKDAVCQVCQRGPWCWDCKLSFLLCDALPRATIARV